MLILVHEQHLSCGRSIILGEWLANTVNLGQEVGWSWGSFKGHLSQLGPRIKEKELSIFTRHIQVKRISPDLPESFKWFWPQYQISTEWGLATFLILNLLWRCWFIHKEPKCICSYSVLNSISHPFSIQLHRSELWCALSLIVVALKDPKLLQSHRQFI